MMKINRLLLSFLLCLTVVILHAQSLEKGVSKELAEQRKATISNVAYDLTFNIPASPREKVTGKAGYTVVTKDEICQLLGDNFKVKG